MEQEEAMDASSRIVAVDPGSLKVGVSLFEDRMPVSQRFLAASGEPYERCIKLVKETARAVRSMRPDVVLCEKPSLFGGSVEGSAAQASGRILILFHFCGMLHYALRRTCPIRFVLPIQWKGNLKKHHTQARIFEKYGIIDREDVIDAIGIADWYVTEGADLKWDGPLIKKRD